MEEQGASEEGAGVSRREGGVVGMGILRPSFIGIPQYLRLCV